ncbi:hypothetical protein Syun_017282 [Stephania yunnanensis]|uniref:Retrotransposon Copia-like N-terminal domain-containing protein n=1 Tax=Stephania yunnanensis TaxID=152371 RepID=A0AAP0P4W0_9MAGN
MANMQDHEDFSRNVSLVDQNMEDSLHLQNSDHPGMILVTNSLTGLNYLTWSRSDAYSSWCKDETRVY